MTAKSQATAAADGDTSSAPVRPMTASDYRLAAWIAAFERCDPGRAERFEELARNWEREAGIRGPEVLGDQHLTP